MKTKSANSTTESKPESNDVRLIDHRRNQAIFLVIAIMLIILGVITIFLRADIAKFLSPSDHSMFSSRTIEEEYNKYVIGFGMTATILCLTGIAQLLFYYLKYGLRIYPKVHGDINVINNNVDESISIISDRLLAIEKTLVENIGDHEELLRLVGTRNIDVDHNTSTTDIPNSLQGNFVNLDTDNKVLSSFNYHYDKTFIRLNKAIESLDRRGNVNLLIGIMTALVGLIILGYTVFTLNHSISYNMSPAKSIIPDKYNPQDNIWLITAAAFLPRLSLVIIIEMFSYFFLSLYRSSLNEIKYFQNELTNIESKCLGLEGALFLNDLESTRNAITSLTVTERNFILKKGESTADIEKSKLDNSVLKDILTSLSGLDLSLNNKKKK